MNNLPNAEVSPRIVNGVLRWYAGDTFDIQIEIDLKDQDEEPITIGPDDTVTAARTAPAASPPSRTAWRSGSVYKEERHEDS